MQIFLFKLFLRLSVFLQVINLRLRVYYFKTLYKSRFSVLKQFSCGRLFGLHFDASASLVAIGSGVQFRNYCEVRSGMDGELIIGNQVFFNNFCSITCFHSITIGNNCQFGEGVKFYDHNHLYNNTDKPINQQGYSKGSIRIGDNCWLGSNVIVLKDVEIGDNVVVGAGCIIHKSIPSNTVVINKQEYLYRPY